MCGGDGITVERLRRNPAGLRRHRIVWAGDLAVCCAVCVGIISEMCWCHIGFYSEQRLQQFWKVGSKPVCVAGGAGKWQPRGFSAHHSRLRGPRFRSSLRNWQHKNPAQAVVDVPSSSEASTTTCTTSTTRCKMSGTPSAVP